MSQGVLFANFRIRTWLPRALVQSLKLDIEILDPLANGELWEKHFPLKKVPCYLGPDGFTLTEQLAIVTYLVHLSGNKTQIERLLGSGFKESAEVLQWLSLANSDLCSTFARTASSLNGNAPYSKKTVEEGYAYLDQIVRRYERRLSEHKFLVSDHATLADYLSAIIFTRIFENLYGRKWRQEHTKLTQWFNTITEDPFVSFLWKDVKLCEEPLQPPQ